MSLCYRFKRYWHVFKNSIYGYDETSCGERTGKPGRSNNKKETTSQRVYFSTDSGVAEGERFFEVYKKSPEKRMNYCFSRGDTKYEAYGIGFETREERDAFECKMENMERILEKELCDLRIQHERLRKKRLKVSFLSDMAKESDCLKNSSEKASHNTWVPSLSDSETSTFLPTDGDPLIEEISLLNEFQDVYEHMCNLSKEVRNIQNVLKIEVRERTLHPEPRLIPIKVPEDELSEQMKNDGGFRYYSSDSSVQQISYDTLPPPLTLSSFLDNDDET